jgi:hypothetical protein
MNATTVPTPPSPAGDRPATRGLVIAMAVAGAIGTSLLGFGSQYLSTVWTEKRATKTVEVSKFIDKAQDFDKAVTAFMVPFLKDANDTVERQAVRDNIQAQHILLDGAKTHLAPAQARRATEYQARLVVIGDELDRHQAAPQAQKLVQAIANAEATEVCVVFDLREAAGLPVIESDRKPCSSDLSRYQQS